MAFVELFHFTHSATAATPLVLDAVSRHAAPIRIYSNLIS